MSITMNQIHHIREMYYQQDKNISEIATETGLNWKTVRKYVDKEDFNQEPPTPAEPGNESKLDPFKSTIDSWLLADKKAPRKQRHTAKRIYKRLNTELDEFPCSYRLVALYVSKKKKELNIKKQEGYIPLIHSPGEAQADFGYADFYENGKLYQEAKYLVLSFPFSNGGYLQLNYGENMECLLEGLVATFEYIGGVPTEIWFDNTRTIVTEIIKGGNRTVTDRFQRFSEHYRFRPVFMNPNSGWEKGNVENKVGYLRRNELVPVPKFANIIEKNKELFLACDQDMNREHYANGDERLICQLFEEDRKAFLSLPPNAFDTALYTTARTDKYGKFTLEKGKHQYSTSPAFCEDTVRLKITSSQVIVMDNQLHEVVTHRRLYGSDCECMDWIPYLTYIARKPRSLKNSGIYSMMPDNMQLYMDRCASNERGKILKILAELTQRSGFPSALNTVEQAIQFHATDPDSLQNLYRRTYAEVPLLAPLENGVDIPVQNVIPFRNDLASMDALLKKGARVNG